MKPIIISCIGDLLPADTAYTIGNGIGSNIPGLIAYYSQPDNNAFQNSDVVFCNLEAPLIRNSGIGKLPFAGNPSITQLMKILGITVVSLANNHLLDHGIEGFCSTRLCLEENGFFHIGSKQERISNIVFLERNGKKFAFAAFNAIQDHPENAILAPLEKDILYCTLKTIKKESPDYIIFSLHWGNEYVTFPSPSQVDLAHKLIDSGVNIIAGHHPHVVQPIENYHGGVIIYSLGNFLFDMFWSEKVRNGMQVDLLFHEDKKITYEIKPFFIRTDFTHDYSSAKKVLSIIEKAEKKLESFQKDKHENHLKSYMRECNRQRFLSRLQMKFFLLKNFFNLDPVSRELFFKNIIMKFSYLWKKN